MEYKYTLIFLLLIYLYSVCVYGYICISHILGTYTQDNIPAVLTTFQIRVISFNSQSIGLTVINIILILKLKKRVT